MDKNQNSITPFTSYQKFIIAIVALGPVHSCSRFHGYLAAFADTDEVR